MGTLLTVQYLNYVMTITDPTVFSEPATYDKCWLAQGEELLEFNCRSGGSYAAD